MSDTSPYWPLHTTCPTCGATIRELWELAEHAHYAVPRKPLTPEEARWAHRVVRRWQLRKAGIRVTHADDQPPRGQP